MTKGLNELAREQVALRKEQAFIRKQLGVEDEEVDSASDAALSIHEEYISSADELDEESDKMHSKCPARTISVMSSDGGYMSSDEDKQPQYKSTKSVSFVVDLNDSTVQENDIEKYIKSLPLDLQKLLEGISQGIPNDYTVPIDKKPDWLDMKKMKVGQMFAQKFYFGLNYSEMLSLLILFAFPDGLQPLIFTGNSGTPFTAFRRYLSTVMRVKSWFEHDVFDEKSLAYKNMKTVRAMHLNVSKRLNSVPYDKLKTQLTVTGPSNDTAVWSNVKNKVQEDFQSGCPVMNFRPIDHERVGKVFVNQLDMSITQFGFVGLMIMHPEKFGAGNATEEELEGFVHLWRGLGYLLGIEDRFNFCNGTLDEIRRRCHYLVDNWVKPSFQHVTEDWEHMSRCMVEGVSYYVPGVSFEVSLLYLCWVLDIPAPRLYASLSWGQTIMFNIMKMTMCFTLRIPGMLTFHNWLIRRSLHRASSWTPDHLEKLQSKTYSYQKKESLNTRL
ncbi:uncharacterized protein LOC128987158 [Macrosteles quadrilineatus]|uniref:uncharacterized protein LOC128987158 n=1 Tax=Macrosteles quadrilineatus TaxID=74068 RepID=UPI0023E24F2D|nr:uncharacterized protein LOC128987158 [Macrosteles quadrilineatus]XP_054263870.1 uncharacterized protein LOC128987158 [Macrosteles quadrilineatus]XP_054263871.1 uncharacterized protein LOC128987158 [Macrosteles quadrilineatus]